MVVVDIRTSKEDQKIVRGFTRFEDQMRDLSEPFKLIVEDFFELEKYIFKVEGYPKPFAPLRSKQYIKWKALNFPGQTILRLHDNLFNALTGRTPKNSLKAAPDIRIGKRTLFLGVKSPYIKAQEKAGREPIQLTEETKRKWFNMIHRWVYNLHQYEVLGERNK